MINIALYQPDIPQNTAAIIRLCACFNIKVHIIEPCGFNLNDSRFKRVAMDYAKLVKISKYESFNTFRNKNSNSRIILISKKMIFYFLEEKVLVFQKKCMKRLVKN